MAKYLASQYVAEVEKLYQYSGSKNETAIRFAFQKLLDSYCKARQLVLVPELEYLTPKGTAVNPDGTIKDALRISWGWWESKDEADDIDVEIAKKKQKGYPFDNILFEDSLTAVLIQNGVEQARISMHDPEALDQIIERLLEYERPEVATFRKAIEAFKNDIPNIVSALKGMIEKAEKTKPSFLLKRTGFLSICKESINPDITMFDIDEMVIQHILTSDIFNSIFDDALFHHNNAVALELEKIISDLMTPEDHYLLLDAIQPYYKVIKAAAAQIADIHEKQKFLKIVYENFYKAYNPAGADRLGVVYTPNEIVGFMTESADWLLNQSFGKLISDSGVDILDPCTGTGTFLTNIVDLMSVAALEKKYPTEMHANEVAILPYYIASLNIEYTFKQKVGRYASFPGICFVDTLENLGFHSTAKDKMLNLGIGAENIDRIKRQNLKKISLVIGNPPYNANQQSANDNNKNRTYKEIDKRIKDSYLAESKAQKTKLYDPYVRFIRWASDRIDENGIVAFITNRSYLDARGFDGFRLCLQKEFDAIYILDLGGDVRKNPRLSGTTHNVFGIQTGVAICFLIRQGRAVGAKASHSAIIHYHRRDEYEKADEKLQYLNSVRIADVPFEHIVPDKDGNWLNIASNSWEDLVPLATKEGKEGKSDEAIFHVHSPGVSTNRDEWVYGHSLESVSAKMKYFITEYEKGDANNKNIKWSESLQLRLGRGQTEKYSKRKIMKVLYRPFVEKFLYYSTLFIDRPGQMDKIFPFSEREGKVRTNLCIAMSGVSSTKPFQALAADEPVSLDFLEKTQIVPLYIYSSAGKRLDNITDWAQKLFESQYGEKISKEEIFAYCYAVLHDASYLNKYRSNLTKALPRIPLYSAVHDYVKLGRRLLKVHTALSQIKPFPIKIATETLNNSKFIPLASVAGSKIKVLKKEGKIQIKSGEVLTTIYDIPEKAWEFIMGNRSAVEWILDQYSERKAKDKTIEAHFKDFRTSEYLDSIAVLIGKVISIGIETIECMSEIAKLPKI
jgi:predicted helicase